MTRVPNLLWICTDQQRFDTIGALGNPWVSTPHIDGLVAAGVAFTHAYCQSPICTPSRASAYVDTRARLCKASFDATVRAFDRGPPRIGPF
jgi:hypothetical protein